MATLIVLFNLKEGQSPEEYERWARDVDVPTVSDLDSVNSFRAYRAQGLLGSDAASPYRYVEVIQVADMNALGKDIATEPMQKIAQAFQQMADNPTFIVCEQFA